jgi:hypothetical protein
MSFPGNVTALTFVFEHDRFGEPGTPRFRITHLEAFYTAAVREPAQTRFRRRPLFQRPAFPHLHNKKT